MIVHYNRSFLLKVITYMFSIQKKIYKSSMITRQLAKPQMYYVPKAFHTHQILRGMSVWSYGDKESKKHVFFLHGGAYVMKSNAYHEKFIQQLVKDQDLQVHVLDYPIAPIKNFFQTVENTCKAVRELLSLHNSKSCYLIGDSAGGGLCTTLAYKLCRDGYDVNGLFLISPWLDITMSHPIKKNVLKSDSILCKDVLFDCATKYAKNNKKHPFASPLNIDWTIPANTHVYCGTSDILVEDSIRFEEKDTKNVQLHMFDKAPHAFAIFPKIKEQKIVINNILTNLQ